MEHYKQIEHTLSKKKKHTYTYIYIHIGKITIEQLQETLKYAETYYF